MRRVLLLCLALGCSGRVDVADPTPEDARTLEATALVERLAAVESATRGLDASRSARRRLAGHVGLVGYRRTHAPEVAAKTVALLTPFLADDSSPERCEAVGTFAELSRAMGDDAAAAREIERALAVGTGSVACRERLRVMGSALGLEANAEVHGDADASGRIVGVDVLGASAESRSVRVVLTLDGDVRGELLEPLTTPDGRVARLRFDALGAAGVPVARAVGAAGLRAVAPAPSGEFGLDLQLEDGATVRGYVLADPVRWILDVELPAATTPGATGPMRLVVIDPGHGGDEHGARVDGIRESHLVLDIATRAAARLRTLLPSTRVLLTRTTDDEVSLEQRSALANSLGADLFVSVHLNDADVPVTTGGITSFVLDTADERQAVRLAARENTTTTDRVGGLSVLLAGLHREGQVAESRRLASFVHAETLARARESLPRLPDRGVRSATYYVLVGTRMPSMLIECSFMTRPEELAQLRQETHRQRLGEGIAQGIARYAASR